VLEETEDHEQIIERVAALDIGKAELVCCIRVPGEGSRRRQEVATYSTSPTWTRRSTSRSPLSPRRWRG
jgi:hypothetical protein